MYTVRNRMFKNFINLGKTFTHYYFKMNTRSRRVPTISLKPLLLEESELPKGNEKAIIKAVKNKIEHVDKVKAEEINEADANNGEKKLSTTEKKLTKKAVKIKIESADKVEGAIGIKEADKNSGEKKLKLERYPQLKETLSKYDDNYEIKVQTEGKWLPKNWKTVMCNIAEMRSLEDAAVDLMGCSQCADDLETPEVKRFHILVSLILSSQTKDEITFAAMERLKKHGLTVENVLQTSKEQLQELIYPVGFYKTKAVYIKTISETLKNKYNSDIPDTLKGLCELKGVGPKMAHICMNVAWNVITGIGVDTHVHRISNRIGWVRKSTKTPENTRKELEDWLPSDLWSDVNHMLVGFGQTVCKPVKPKCEDCLNFDICPYTKSAEFMKRSPRKTTPKKQN